MSSARSRILERVRRAATTGRIPTDGVRSLSGGPPAAAADPRSVRDRFLQELDALGVRCHVASSAEEVRSRVAEIVGARSVFSWDLDRLPYSVGDVLDTAVVASGDGRDRHAGAEIGVTGCHGAIAETGSIAVLSGPGMPRAASLLPPIHLCIVRTADLHGSMGAFFRARSEDIGAAACCTFITGPSRTADIELTLTLGVHGPGAVVVVLGP